MKQRKIETFFEKVLYFLNHDLWVYPLKEARGWRLYAFKCFRTAYIAIKGFYKDMCFLRSSALTFYSTMSLVPVLAMSFAIARGFGYQKHLQEQLYTHFGDQKELVNELLRFAQNLLDQTRGGVIAGVGIVILIWSVLKVLHHIEKSFNSIWKVRKSRTIARKFSDYFALMVISPLFFILASSITVFVVSKLQSYIRDLPLYETVSSFLIFMIQLLPYCLIWILFTFLYLFIPNTKVRFGPSLVAGIIAGSVYQFGQWIYIYSQVGTARYNAIYGSFAALPLFLIWVYLSWLIVLLGAEIAYGYQNVERYDYGWRIEKMNHRLRILLSVWVVHQALDRFRKREKPFTKDELFEELELPFPMIDTVVDELAEAKILLTIKNKKEDEYVLGIPIEDLRIKDVMDLIEDKGVTLPEIPSDSFHKIQDVLHSFGEEIANSDKNRHLKDI